jgi:(1->4)-alpha-D-glucan 1-alpha-D-glucosylmutase
MIQALREGRERSDWGINATSYERTLSDFITQAFGDADFLAQFHPVCARLQAIGRRKGLIQAALKLTIPGVPDIYRGAEDWEQSFVDPDNRRHLDFAALASRLAAPVAGRDDKLVLTQSLLGLRRRLPAVFAGGSYEPLDCGADILGFRRRHGSDEVLVLADLSPGHDASIAAESGGLTTVVGSAAGPVWVLATP